MSKAAVLVLAAVGFLLLASGPGVLAKEVQAPKNEAGNSNAMYFETRRDAKAEKTYTVKFPNDTTVAMLDEGSFETFINEHEVALVFFYSEKFPECVEAAANFAQVADNFVISPEEGAEDEGREHLTQAAEGTGHGESPSDSTSSGKKSEESKARQRLAFAAVNYPNYPSIAIDEDIRSAPMLRIFRDGTAYDYDGAFTLKALANTFSAHASPDWSPPVSKVLVLTDQNFTLITRKRDPVASLSASSESAELGENDLVGGADVVMVEFYSPHCGACKALAPQYELAARRLVESAPNARLAKVDASENPEVAARYSVNKYPTLIIFRGSYHFPYSGELKAKAIKGEMVRQSRPPAVLVNELDSFEMMFEADVAAIGMFTSNSSAAIDIFQEAASRHRYRFSYGFVTNPEIVAKYHVKEDSVFIFYPRTYIGKSESRGMKKKIGTDPAELADWLGANGYADVGFRDAQSGSNIQKYETTDPVVVLYFDIFGSNELQGHVQFWRNKFISVAKNYETRGLNKNLFFAISSETTYADEMKRLGRDASDYEFTVAIYSNGDTYLMDDEFSVDAAIDFVDEFLDGNLEKYIKSEPVPKGPKKKKGAVRKVVGYTFNDIVMDPTKDVFLELYAPWCKHCKEFNGMLKRLAKKLRTVKEITVAQLDCTKNEFPKDDFPLHGYPTIYLVKRDPSGGENKIVTRYKGDRELKVMLGYLEKETGLPIPQLSPEEVQKEEDLFRKSRPVTAEKMRKFLNKGKEKGFHMSSSHTFDDLDQHDDATPGKKPSGGSDGAKKEEEEKYIPISIDKKQFEKYLDDL